MESVRLPVVNQSGYYEIRLESIGGLGANLCGKMMGELGTKYMGLNSASFSSYGSEKTGTPVKAFIRYCEVSKDIRVHSPVTTPHLLGIFHDALIQDHGIFSGCNSDSIVVMNTENNLEDPCAAANHIPPVKCIFTVPAQKIAIETHSRINVVMLGAMAKVSGFIPIESVNKICEETLGRKYPQTLSNNLEGIRRGYNEVKRAELTLTGRTEVSGEKETEAWGYQTAPIGGVNPRFGSSVISDLSASRQGYFPVFLKERCINCGLCDSACPDMVFQFQKGEYRGKEMMVNTGLDYYHCKGCLRCVSVCPVQALVKGVESEHPDKQWFLPNQDLIRVPDYYEAAGPDGYVTSESYLTEKRIEGGEI